MFVKIFRIYFSSGREIVTKADDYETFTHGNNFMEGILRKDHRIIARLNLDHVECIEEVIEYE